MTEKLFKHSRLGVEVLPGCNLANLTEQQMDELKTTLWEHGVVVVKNQHLSASQLEEFARQTFGETIFGTSTFDPEIAPELQSPRVFILRNSESPEWKVIQKASWKWHQDKDGIPSTEGLDMNALYVVMLYGVKIVPEGLDGQPHTTEFLDLVEAYNNLEPERQQQLERMSMYHLPPMFSKRSDREEPPKKLHPIASVHQMTGKKGLYLGSDSAIPVGMEDRPEEALGFYQELLQTVLDRVPIYSHAWHPGDLLFWDNSQVMHRGTPYDESKYERIALRVGVVDRSSVS